MAVSDWVRMAWEVYAKDIPNMFQIRERADLMLVRKIKLRGHLWHNLESYRFGKIRGSGRCHFWTTYWVLNLIRFEYCKNTGRSNSGWVTLTHLPSLSLVFFLLLVLASYAKHVPSIWQACDKHMTSIWQACDKHNMTSVWQAYDKHMTNIMVHVRHSLGALISFLAFRSVRAVPDWVHME